MDIPKDIFELQNNAKDATLDLPTVEELYEKMTKEKRVKEVHKASICTRKDGRFITKVRLDNGIKQVSGKNKSELYQKLFLIYFGKELYSLQDIFPLWQDFRKNETAATEKTIKEDLYIWNSMLADTSIVTVPLRNLKTKDFIRFFRILTKDRTLTKKRFNNMKSVLNGMIYYAVEEEIVEHNCLNDIDYRKFAYKPENNRILPYTEEERERIIASLRDDDLYDLAINLDFHMIARIGEIKALKWTDIKNGFIHIERFMNEQKEIVDHVKGNASAGMRYIPITPTVEHLLVKIKEVNPDSEYLFINDNFTLSTCTFNRHLKRHCNELGIEYRSSHKIRFSGTSILNKNGMELTELQQLLGHTTLTMTCHYVRNITPKEETREKFNAILG